MPLTENGFNALSYDELLQKGIEKAQLLFGEDIETDESSTMGKLIRLICNDAFDNQETAEDVYLSAFPNTASGVSLDRIAVFEGVSRNPAAYAQHTVVFTGTADTVIPMGFLVSADNGAVVFHTMDSYTIGAGGTVTATVECNESGTVGNVAVGTIDEIVNPIADVTGVSHTAQTYMGADAETDYSLRNRLEKARSASGSATTAAILSAVMQVSGVEGASIVENDTDSTVDGIPPHSFMTYVLANASLAQSIAEAIYKKKPAGVTAYGTQSVTVTDSGGGEHTIGFSWAETKTVYIRCTLSVNENYPDNGTATIVQSIVERVAGLANGESLTATSLYAPIYNSGTEGVLDATGLEMSLDGAAWSASTITAEDNEVIRTNAAYITILIS